MEQKDEKEILENLRPKIFTIGVTLRSIINDTDKFIDTIDEKIQVLRNETKNLMEVINQGKIKDPEKQKLLSQAAEDVKDVILRWEREAKLDFSDFIFYVDGKKAELREKYEKLFARVF